MMLTKAVEAAREGLVQARVWIDHRGALEIVNYAIAALPEKPMTEAELIDLVYNALDKAGGTMRGPWYSAAQIAIKELKAANVLYCEEK